MSEAQEVLDTAVQNQQKKRRYWRGCLIVFLILALPYYWVGCHTTRLHVSKETTYALGPMTSDGKRIDYFRAMEERFYPPEMKTDDNGYRLIVRACGVEVAASSCCPVPYTGQKEEETFTLNPLQRQIYDKLGLEPPTKRPTMKIESPVATEYLPKYDSEHPPAEGEDNQSEKFRQAVFWTFDDFPMLKDWLDENTAGIDLLGEAVRKPAFFVPYVREQETASFFDVFLHSDATTPPKGLAKAAQARAKYRLGIGDIDGAIDDIITMHFLARHTGKQGTLIFHSVAAAIEGAANSMDITVNPKFPPTRGQIERLIRELNALPPRWTVKEVLESERYFVLGNLLGDYWGYSEPLAGGILSVPAVRWIIDINIFLERMNEIYDAVINETTIDGKTLEEFQEWALNSSRLPLTVRSRSLMYAEVTLCLLGDVAKNIREIQQRSESALNANLEKLQNYLDGTATALP